MLVPLPSQDSSESKQTALGIQTLAPPPTEKAKHLSHVGGGPLCAGTFSAHPPACTHLRAQSPAVTRWEAGCPRHFWEGWDREVLMGGTSGKSF